MGMREYLFGCEVYFFFFPIRSYGIGREEIVKRE